MKECDFIDSKSREEWEKLINNWIHNERDRKMLKRRLLDGIKFEDLAEEFDISTNYCQVRIKKAKKQLFGNLPNKKKTKRFFVLKNIKTV